MDPDGPISTRIAIARFAERAIAADPGVAPTDGGGRWLTRDGERTIPGIVATASGAGRVEVAVHLVAHLPPRPLAKQAADLRSEIQAAARSARLADGLGPIDVTIHDLREAERGGAAA
jgi:hypothetical protein